MSRVTLPEVFISASALIISPLENGCRKVVGIDRGVVQEVGNGKLENLGV